MQPGYCKNYHELGGLKQHIFTYSFTILSIRSPKPKWQQRWLIVHTVRKNLSQLQWWPVILPMAWLAECVASISASIFTWLSPCFL